MDEQLIPAETQQEEPEPADEQPSSEVVVSELEDDEWQD